MTNSTNYESTSTSASAQPASAPTVNVTPFPTSKKAPRSFFSRPRRCCCGGNVTVNVYCNRNDERTEPAPRKSIFLRLCDWIGKLLLISIIAGLVSTYVFIELDYVSSETLSHEASFEWKLETFLSKRGLYIRWRGLMIPQIYRIDKIPLEPRYEHHENFHGRDFIIRYMGEGMEPTVLPAYRDNDGNWYWKNEYIIFPESERGRG